MAVRDKHVTDDTERRVLVLYALQQLGGAGQMQLIVLMDESKAMNYFDLHIALSSLHESGLIVPEPMLADTLWHLTAAGEETLKLYAERAALSLREAIDQAAAAFREPFRRERQLATLVSHEGGLAYHAQMELNEQGHSLMKLDLSVPTAAMAKRLCDRWPKQAGRLYELIVRALGEDEA